MMRIRSSRTIGITFVIMASFAMMTSAPAMTAPNGITYDCDTAADHFSELVLPAPKGPFIVRGQVKVKAIAASEEYVPLTRLAIMEAPEKLGASSQNQAGFSLAALPAGKLGVKTKDKNAVLHFANWDERKAGSEVSHDLFPLADTQDARPFSLAYDGKSVVAQFAGQQQTMALDVDAPVVRLICSTGEFLYTNLTIDAQ